MLLLIVILICSVMDVIVCYVKRNDNLKIKYVPLNDISEDRFLYTFGSRRSSIT